MAEGWWWCCVVGCWMFTDTFDRADNTDCGPWYEYSGDWGIDENQLEEPFSP